MLVEQIANIDSEMWTIENEERGVSSGRSMIIPGKRHLSVIRNKYKQIRSADSLVSLESSRIYFP